MHSGNPRLDLIAWEEYILANERATTSYYRYRDHIDERYKHEDHNAERTARREQARQQRACDPA